MSTTFEFPELQNDGDICKSCRPFWESQRKRPKRMVALRDRRGCEIKTDGPDDLLCLNDDGELEYRKDQNPPTRRRDVPIIVCPHCDGDTILRLARK